MDEIEKLNEERVSEKLNTEEDDIDELNYIFLEILRKESIRLGYNFYNKFKDLDKFKKLYKRGKYDNRRLTIKKTGKSYIDDDINNYLIISYNTISSYLYYIKKNEISYTDFVLYTKSISSYFPEILFIE